MDTTTYCSKWARSMLDRAQQELAVFTTQFKE